MGDTSYLKGRCQQTNLTKHRHLQSPLRVNEGMETVLTLSKPLLPTLPSYPRTTPCTGLTLPAAVQGDNATQKRFKQVPHAGPLIILALGRERKKDGEEYKASWN